MFPALWGFLTPLVHNTPLSYIAETVEVIENVRERVMSQLLIPAPRRLEKRRGAVP